jgi:hypothetical protein
MIYLIECGSEYILYWQEQQVYFLASEQSDYLCQFMSGCPEPTTWHGAREFVIHRDLLNKNYLCADSSGVFIRDKSDLLKLFYDPISHSGAVIASLAQDEKGHTIYNKYAFLRVKALWL